MQTNAFGPLVAFGSWVCGRNIPSDVYASFSWDILKAKRLLQEEESKA
jgi:hypothetical protein